MRLRGLGLLAAGLWVVACIFWFDPAVPLRPFSLGSVAPVLVVGASLAATASWARSRWPLPAAAPDERRLVLLGVFMAVLFRLPLTWHGAAGYVTPDGALSGIVALRLADGGEHFVFVPRVPYSGSAKSHVAAALVWLGLDAARAFALASLAFYALFVAAVVRISWRVATEDGSTRWLPGAVAAFAAFAPAFVTRYSLSNDGNYVEPLALGAWALLLALRFVADPASRRAAAWMIGILLGVAFWSHILAMMHVAAIGLFLLATTRLEALRALPRLGGGFGLGYFPGLLWNVFNRWESVAYVVPGGRPVGAIEQGPGLAGRAWAVLGDHLPVLLGYDHGYGPGGDALLTAVAWATVALAVAGVVVAIRDVARSGGRPALVAVLLTTGVCLAIAIAALPVIPGDARYLLFLMTTLPILLARVCRPRALRAGLAVVVGANAVASLAQAWPTVRSDGQWRAFVADLQRAGVTRCTTDFFLATKINFLSGERIVCSSALGPTTTEYFLDYRDAVAGADRVALIAVNGTAAAKLERRLQRLSVPHRRLELLKPVLLPGRPVTVDELFPNRADQLSPDSDPSNESR